MKIIGVLVISALSICAMGLANATESEYQKDLKRYEQLKPQVYEILKESHTLYVDMPDAAAQRAQGNPTEWRAMMDNIEKLRAQTIKTLGNQSLDPVFGSCIQMTMSLPDYWLSVIKASTKENPWGSSPEVNLYKALYKEKRMDCLDSYVFGPKDRSDLAVLNIWDDKK